MTHNTSPIIPWMGGKSRLAEKLLPLFPAHKCYVEVFCGGAAMYFLRPMPAQAEIINDINGDLVNLYRVVQHHLDAFVQQFRWALTSRQMFKWLQMTNAETLTDIQRAARFFYLQQHAFGARIEGQNFGTATTGPVVNLLRIEESLSSAHLRLAGGTTVENLPWRKCVEKYDREHTFFYMDPPYWETEGYGVDFPWAEYEAIATVMREAKGKVMLSINAHPDIRALFAEFRMEELSIKYTVGNQSGGSIASSQELVIMNYPDESLGGLFN